MKKAKFNFDKLEETAVVLKAIAHPLRLAILQLLDEQKNMSVTNIHQRLGVEQAVASHHLAILKNCDIVSIKKDGKNVFYSLSNAKVSHLINSVDKLIK